MPELTSFPSASIFQTIATITSAAIRACMLTFATWCRNWPRFGHDDIVLNTCITSENLPEINRIADKAKEWGVNLCYSSYSARRTGCRDYSLNTPEQLALLNSELDRIESRRDGSNWIVNAPTTLQATRQFFKDGKMPGCKAGHRFLVVTSNGMLQPCSMVFQKYKLEEHARMVEEFTKTNPATNAMSRFAHISTRAFRNC